MTDIVERLLTMENFYMERPSVDQEVQTPTTTELSEREADQIAIALHEARAEIERLRAAVEESREAVKRSIDRLCAASQWQPIETAPKDGTEFIAYRDDVGPFLLRWSCAAEMMTDSEIEQSMMTDEEVHEPDWFFADFATGGRLNDRFTHWQPLPSPPTQDGGE